MPTSDPTNPDHAAPEPPSLEDQLVARLRRFVAESAARLNTLGPGPHRTELVIHLLQPGGDDDGTLCLEAQVEERTHEDFEGRVPGVGFR